MGDRVSDDANLRDLKDHLAARAEELGLYLFGEPSKKTRRELRWGRKGSTLIRLDRGTFRSWEADVGGSLIDAFAFAHDCSIKDAIDHARRWLGESLGSIQLDGEDGVVSVRLLGKLEPSAYDGVSEEIDRLMSRSEHVRLMLDLREFDGWSGLAAIGDHLSLVREHRRVPERIAVVGDRAWQNLAEKLMSRFVNARSKFFDAGDFDGAKAWLSA